MDLERVSVGVAAMAGADVIRRIAPEIEAAGFRGLWINEVPGTDALELAAAAAAATSRLAIGTGVIAVDRRPPGELVDEIARLGLPEDRFLLGIGSGGAGRGALALVRDATARLRDELAVPVVVGALGPRMRRLAATDGDGVVLNWLDPATAAEQTAEHHAIAPRGRVALYVRTVSEPAALPRLEREAARYAGFPKYAANFDRLGIGALDTVLPAPGDEAVEPGLRRYLDAVDEVVLRAITPADTVDDYLRFIADVV